MNKRVGGGRFELLRRLGAGGMGVVYEALDHELGLSVALKRLNRIDGQTLYRFKKEFRSLQGLDHPNLVRLGELFEDGRNWFFTMELVEGVDILSYFRPSGELEVDRLRPVLAQLAQGLAALHSAGKVHRDVKPANVLVTHDQRVVVVDFGLVYEIAQFSDQSEITVVGTAAYMAPEQAACRPVGPAADWYAFGVILYEALTGLQPYQGNMLEVFTAKQVAAPVAPDQLVQDLPQDLAALAMELMNFLPSERPSVGEVLGVLGVTAGAESSAPSRSLSGEPAPFVGREKELAALQDSLERAIGGQATRVFVVGEAGVGKSRLLRELAARANQRTPAPLVLHGRCYERESVHYKGVDGVIDALSRHLQLMQEAPLRELLPDGAELLPSVFPVLGRIAAIGRRRSTARGSRDPIAFRTRIFGVLRALFCELCKRQPVMIMIDDYQWADADSELLIRELLQQPSAPPLLIVASTRSSPQASDARVIELGVLAADDARGLASSLLERLSIRGADALAIATESGGHPLFIDEMARHAALAGATHQGSWGLDDAIAARIDGLSQSAVSVLEIISVVGTPVERELLSEASELVPGELERAISQLRVARMVRAPSAGALEPYHERIGRATLARLAAGRVRAIHARLAAAIEASELAEERPELLVEHLAAAGEISSAASYAERAAERAANVFAFERAAELYRIALEHGSSSKDERRSLQRSLADALANAGRGRDAAPLYLSAAASSDPAHRAECQRLAARHLLLNGYFEQGMRALEDTLSGQGLMLPSSPKRALASLLWQRMRLRARGTRWRERHQQEIADTDLARVDVMLDVGEAMGMFDTVAGADFQMRGLREALRLGEPTRVARGLGVEGIYTASQGHRRLPRARGLVAQMHGIAEKQRNPFLEALAHTADGIVAYLGGQLVEAAVALRDTEDRYRELGSRWELNNARLFRLFATRWTGGFDARAAELRELARDAHRRGDLYTETALRLTGNLLHLAQDRPDDAELDLEAVSWQPASHSYHVLHWWELEARTELALYRDTVGEDFDSLAESFAELRASLLPRVQFVRTNSRWTWARLCVAVARKNNDSALRAGAQKIAAQLDREGVSYARVWSQLLRASLAEQAGNRPLSRELLSSAAALAQDDGMPLLAYCARLHRGDDGTAAAWFESQGVAEPALLARVFVG